MYTQYISGCLSILVLTSTLSSCYPQLSSSQIAAQYLPQTKQQTTVHQVHASNQNQALSHKQLQQQQQQLQVQSKNAEHDDRKFAEKPNALKKVALDDIDEDIQTNQIQDGGTFSWTNILGSVMQMFFNNPNMAGPNKSEDFDTTNTLATSPWANVISVGLKILTSILGGGGGVSDGIDKVDNGGGGSPMQSILTAVFSGVLGARDPEQVTTMAKQANEFITIVMNLLDALKTSFSHRSLAARSLGKKDSFSDFSVASISMIKGYIKTSVSPNEKCAQKYLCDANKECNSDIGGNSIFCQLGSYATSYAIEKSIGNNFETLYEAGRRGRSGEKCQQIYTECSGL